MRYFILAIFYLILSVSPAAAHLAGGQDVVSGDYLIDVGWEPAELMAGQKTFLAFNLADPTALTPIEFDRMFFRIDLAGTTVFSGNFDQEQPGNTSLILTAPQPGEYAVVVRFFRDQELLTQQDLTWNFIESEISEPAASDSSRTIGFWFGIIAAVNAVIWYVVIFFVIRRFRK